MPATNHSPGGAQVPSSYTTYGEMVRFARQRREELAGTPARDIGAADMFCVALRRGVFEAVGQLDERLDTGSVQDDYARRVRDAGHQVSCAYDVFAHRFGERLDDHPEPADAALAQRVEAAVRQHVPAGSTVLVVSREDQTLVASDGREVWTFAQLEDGSRSDHHPTGDEEAIAELERLRERGAAYLVLPATSLWWLERYRGLRDHLERYRCASEDPESAVIYELSEPTEARVRGGRKA